MGVPKTIDFTDTCQYYSEVSVDNSCVNYTNVDLKKALKKCAGKIACDFKMQKSYFKNTKKCKDSITEKGYTDIILGFYCD